MKLLTIAALAALFAFPAFAQQQCGPTQNVMTYLATKYGERVVDETIIDHPEKPGVRLWLRVWANLETGTWSVTGTANRFTCLYEYGENYDGQDIDWVLSKINGETDA